MKAPKYTIDNLTFGFSPARIRRDYPTKEDFVNDMMAIYDGRVNKTKLKSMLNKVAAEAFPPADSNKEEGAQ